MASPAVPKFDATTIKRPGAGGGGESGAAEALSNREYLQEGDAFTLLFTLPFRREDIYRELTSARQLGVDHTTVKISITKRTDEAEDLLQRKLERRRALS